MSEATKIEWCDSTFNPWIGCTKNRPVAPIGVLLRIEGCPAPG